MSRNFKGKGASDTIPAWLSLKIRDAGASAYAWGEAELLDRIDPGQRLQRLNDHLTTTVVVAGGAVLTSLGFAINTASGLITLVITAAALLHTRGRAWSPLTLAAVLVAIWPERSEALGVVSLALLGVLAACAYLKGRGARTAAAAASLLSLWAATAALGSMIPLILLAVTACALVAAGVIRPKLSNDIPFLRPGTPPTTIPFLVRVLKRREVRNVPDDIRRKTLGAEGERATALRLMGLQGQRILGITTRAKAIAVHDIASLDPEKTRANLDHLLLTPQGLFVLDTKVFARGSNVALSADSGDVVVTAPGTPGKSIMPLIMALSKECVATRNALGHETTGFLVIHGARVPAGLSVRLADDAVTVEVIDQKDLIGRLDAPRRGGMTGREFKSLAKAVMGIPSASGGRSVPVRPLGITFANRPRVPAPVTPSLVVGGRAPQGERPMENAAGVTPLMARWGQMLSSPPAPADLVQLDLQSIRRGEKFEVFSIAEDLSSVQMYAMTGVCQAPGGELFAWATNGENWEHYNRTGQPVQMVKVPAGNIIAIATSNS